MLRADSTPGPQAAELSIEGRAVPDYGAHFNFLALRVGSALLSLPCAAFPLFPVPLLLLFTVGC
jgi:hypothetical protein